MLIRWPQFGARARAVWHPSIAWDLGVGVGRCSGSPAAHSENCPLSQPSIISRLAYCSVSENLIATRRLCSPSRALSPDQSTRRSDLRSSTILAW